MNRKIEFATYFLYFLSNVLMLLNPGVYWDDWAIYNMSDEGIMNQFYGNGVYPIGYMHVYLTKIASSPLLYNYLCFLLQFIGIYSLFRILNNYSIKSKNSTFLYLSVLIFAVFPFYDAKITMIVLPYTICLTIFLVANWLLIKYNNNRNIVYRIISLVLFFLSFFTNSLLFFYIVPVYFIFFYEDLQCFFKGQYSGFLKMMGVFSKRILTYLDFFLLPFLFWVLRSIYFMPTMQYAKDYNQITLESLLAIPYRIFKFIYITAATIVPLLKEFFQNPEILILTCLIILIIFKIFPSIRVNSKSNWKMIVWGIIILGLGIFPYILVNKFPSYSGYNSRHQLLEGFGISIIIIAVIFLLPKKIEKLLLASVIGFFVAFNININFHYFKGYIKQQVFHEAFQTVIPKTDKPTTIVLKDKTTDFALRGNPVAFYALSGILKRSNPEENILLIRENDFPKYKNQGLFEEIKPFMFQYNLSGYELTEPEYILNIKYAETKTPAFPMLAYYGDYIMGNKESWNKYFDLSIEPLIKKDTKIN
ncbi:hypothetical protein [uncultured Christiangramia sp.]|uniref:hypothetical protein n=1 Tax=uncultured Christiangramia sp. TaxID=503836 RepID=UPI0026341562|nr:hypothetical protein [uncultured Christiangramia sp.]